MIKSDIKKALYEIKDMSDEEIADNGRFIRNVSEEALALILNLERSIFSWEGVKLHD